LDQLGDRQLGASLHVVLKKFPIAHCAHGLLLRIAIDPEREHHFYAATVPD
jgi:hypothetical protein